MTKAVPGDQTVKLLVGPELPRSPSSGMNQAEGRRELAAHEASEMGAAAKPEVSNSGLTALGTSFWSVLGTPEGGSFAASS